MLRMDQVHVIRHKHYIEGQGIRRIAREMGLNRRTVRKYLEESAPQRKEDAARPRPVLERVSPRIDAILEEWYPRLEGKHRVTSTRVHRQLIEEGYSIGERTVRGYLSEKKRQSREVYIPLVHRAGEEAQVDFFEVKVDEGDQRRSVWKFVMRLMYSGRDFVHLYDRGDQVSFLDGHVLAFEYFGGIPQRVVYDNLKAAVVKIVQMKDRTLSDRFTAMVSHYLFEPCFARPGQGHDKGGVEGRGKGIRLQEMTPIVTGTDLESISRQVLIGLEERWKKKVLPDGRRTEDLYEEEQRRLCPPPHMPFEARKMFAVRISSSATAKVNGALYSVPETWARRDAEAWLGPRDIRFLCRGEEFIRSRERPGSRNIDYQHYIK
ncbi:MAG: IS21 family transposase, partial [Synergistales bacterium]|nr:IS21 family transposase [Synergistales bacterium]